MLVFLLLLAAVILFLLAAFWRTPRNWFLPLGLACFAAAFLLPLLLARF